MFASRSLSFLVLLITELLRKLLQYYMLYMWCFWVEIWTKRLIYYYAYANVANIIVWSFVWRKFSSAGNGEWWDKMKYGQKLKFRDAHITPRNIQEVQASKLGDAPEAPLLHRQKSSRLSTHYIFLLLNALCVFLGASLHSLSVLFCIVCCNKWLDPNKFLLE
jgi:hypothetical protein